VIQTLDGAGFLGKKQEILKHFIKNADYMVYSSTSFPAKEEVNYSQCLVASTIIFLSDIYILTHDKKYFNEVQKMLPLLNAFHGMQPDNHLYEVGLRHFDAFWFGKNERWGDTMPQDWNALSAEAFLRYYEITGEQKYSKKSKEVGESNLCLFFEDGSASCAYIYPDQIDGEAGKFYDPFANDQDWAFYYFLRTHEL
jgi:hypothetical protein